MIIKKFILIPFLSVTCFGYVLSDLDFDRNVDFYDFAIFSNQWLLEEDSNEPDSIGSGTADYFVAASDSLDQVKRKADYVCDGNDDHVEIQAAIDALPCFGGKVKLSTGRFNIGKPINLYRPDVPRWFSVCLEGQHMEATCIFLQNGSNCNMIENVNTGVSVSGWKFIRDLRLEGNKARNTSGSGYYSKRASADSGVCYDQCIHNVFINNVKEKGIHIEDGWHISIFNCWIEMCDGDGLYLLGSEARLSGLQISSNKGKGVLLYGPYHNVSNLILMRLGKAGFQAMALYNSTIVNLSIVDWGQASSLQNALYIDASSHHNTFSNISVKGTGTSSSSRGIAVYGDYNLLSNIAVEDTYYNPLYISKGGNDNLISSSYFKEGACANNTIIDDGANNSIVGCTGLGNEETVTSGSPTLKHWGVTKLNSAAGAITAILPDGQYAGEIKTIVMTDAGNRSTVSATHHETSDPQVAIFDGVDEIWVLIWTGTRWATLKATCDFMSL